MKPISIRFQCFGPYMEEQFIDFAALEASGLFLICGETGSGKTTILDAICYALYNQSSGSTRGKGLGVMRCKQAQKSDVTLTEFVFSVEGRTYKFLRTLEYKRKNIRDEHQCWEERDGTFVPLFENPKDSSVSAKAQELIGLTYDQFRQVIILPQGQFEKLLISDSDEKERILVTLFHAGRWQKISEEVYRRVREQDTALKQERQSCDAKLLEYGCETTDQLAEKAEAAEEALKDLRAQESLQTQQAADLQRQKEQALLLDEAFRRLSKQRQLLEQLQSRQDHFDRTEERLAAAAAAQTLTPQYLQLRQLQQTRAKAANQLQQAQNTAKIAKTQLEKLTLRRQTHEAGSQAQQERTARKALLEAREPIYASLQEQKSLLDTADKVYESRQKQLRKAEQAFSAAHEDWLQAQRLQADAITAYQQAQTLYLQSIGSILAQSLQTGTPCPVCGSTEHPSPAPVSQVRITDEQLDRYNRAVTDTSDRVSQAAKRRQQAEQAKNDAAQLCVHAQQEALSVRAAYTLSLEQRIDGIETLSQLTAALRALQAEIAAYEQEGQNLQKSMQDAAAAAAAAESLQNKSETEHTEAVRSEQEAHELWIAALQEADFPTEAAFEAARMEPAQQQAEHNSLIRYRQDLANAEKLLTEQQNALSGTEAPDMKVIADSLNAALAAAQRLQKQVYLQTEQAARMRQDLSGLRSRLEACAAKRITVDADLEFADRLRGSRGLSLQRYVLGVMLSSITAEANRLLKNVYGGRYQLYRCQELGDRRQKSGLDLEVLDSANGQRRSVKTLSGGEKFLVALGLAIGLSTVVQAQGSGVRLGAMFIDEGFGSLDRDAVCDALDILDGIRKGSGLVGIISHVDQLAETIPTKIEVKKGRTGSSCTVRF